MTTDPGPFAHQLRAYADLCDDMAQTAQELADGAETSDEVEVLADVRADMQRGAYRLRHQALSVVPDPDPEAA